MLHDRDPYRGASVHWENTRRETLFIVEGSRFTLPSSFPLDPEDRGSPLDLHGAAGDPPGIAGYREVWSTDELGVPIRSTSSNRNQSSLLARKC